MVIFDVIVSKFYYFGRYCVYKWFWRICINLFLYVFICLNFLKMWYLKWKLIFLKIEFLDIYLVFLKFWKVLIWGVWVVLKLIKLMCFLKCVKYYSWSWIWLYLLILYCINLIIFVFFVCVIIFCNWVFLVEMEVVDLVNFLVYFLLKINW